MTTAPDPSITDRRNHPVVRVCVEEKRRVLRTLRTLDRVGVDPADDPALQVALIELARFDGLLTSLLELAERTDEDIGGLRDTVEKMRVAGESMRGEVLDVLPPHIQDAVRGAATEVTALEFEVWNEVTSYRAQAARSSAGVDAQSSPKPEQIAAEVWGDPSASPARPTLDAQVRRHEGKPLPDPDAPVRAFFDRAPRPWRTVMAQFHDIEVRGRPALAQRLADRVSDPDWLRRFMVERLGQSEREVLFRLVTAGMEVLDVDDPDDAFFVRWNWERQFPASSGGKLRAAGLVHVARQDDIRIAVVPPPLRELLFTALTEVDPRLEQSARRAARRAEAEEETARPPADRGYRRWHAIDARVTALIGEALTENRHVFQEAAAAVTGDGMSLVMADTQMYHLLEFAGFLWRRTPESSTLAERVALEFQRGAPHEDADAETQAHFQTVAAAPPAIYRVLATDDAMTLQLEPVLPHGPVEKVTDRGLAMTAEPGLLLGARVYDAGPYRVIRLFGGPVEARREKRFLRAIRRERRALGTPDGADGDAGFLRAGTTAVMRLFLEFARPGI